MADRSDRTAGTRFPRTQAAPAAHTKHSPPIIVPENSHCLGNYDERLTSSWSLPLFTTRRLSVGAPAFMRGEERFSAPESAPPNSCALALGTGIHVIPSWASRRSTNVESCNPGISHRGQTKEELHCSQKRKEPPFLGRRPFGVAATSNSQPSGAQGRKIVKILVSKRYLPLHRQRSNQQWRFLLQLLAALELAVLLHWLRGWFHGRRFLLSIWACLARLSIVQFVLQNRPALRRLKLNHLSRLVAASLAISLSAALSFANLR